MSSFGSSKATLPPACPLKLGSRPSEDGVIQTSQLSRLECRAKPLSNGDASLLALYDAFFTGPEVEVLPLTTAVIDKATELRASLRLKTPDALHLAAAILAGAKTFLTGDKALERCKELPVEVL
jgi:predicted nucleic acid-binding protein